MIRDFHSIQAHHIMGDDFVRFKRTIFILCNKNTKRKEFPKNKIRRK